MWLFNDISKISFSISREHTRVTWLVVTLKTHSPGLSVSCNTLVQADGSGDTDVTRDNHYKTWGRERSSLVSAGRNDSPHSLADSTVVFFANILCFRCKSDFAVYRADFFVTAPVYNIKSEMSNGL